MLIKKMLILFVVATAVLIVSFTAGAGAIEFSKGFDQDSYYWYDGSIKRPVFLSLTDLAVFYDRTASVQPDAADLKAVFSNKASVLGGNEFSSVVEMEEGLSNTDLAARGQALVALEGVSGVSRVFYAGPGKNDYTRMIPTGGIIVKYPDLLSDEDIAGIEARFGLTRGRTFSFGVNIFLYKLSDSLESLNTANALFESGLAEYSYPNWLSAPRTRAVPDDPLYGDQWHLNNTGQGGGTAGEDVDIEGVWDDFKGSRNEVIAIVDNGMEIAHEDISPNVLEGQSWDYVDGDDDPTPDPSERHGTACTGVAAARGFNALGVTGAAPHAGLVGHRLLGAYTAENIADSLSRNNQVIDIYSNSWGPDDGGYIIEGPTELAKTALENGVREGRGGLGNIYVWAGGNGDNGSIAIDGVIYQLNDNANYDGYVNSREVICVAASTNLGVKSSYSDPGACVLVNAPSNGGTLGITTTDNLPPGGYNTDGEYYGSFGGTSSACPLAAGIAALVLQANPDLTWRDVRHVFIAAAEKNDPGDGGWTLNGAGLHVSYKYGFGRINASEAVRLAQIWKPAGAEETFQTETIYPELAIPDNNETGVESAIVVDEDLNIEFVEIYFSAADHPYWGDLEVVLTSPSGTESVLAEKHESLSFREEYSAFKYDHWRFGSVRHFGESAKGTWTLRVRDLKAGDAGTFQNWGLKFYGTGKSDPWLVWFAMQTAGDDGPNGCFIRSLPDSSNN